MLRLNETARRGGPALGGALGGGGGAGADTTGASFALVVLTLRLGFRSWGNRPGASAGGRLCLMSLSDADTACSGCERASGSGCWLSVVQRRRRCGSAAGRLTGSHFVRTAGRRQCRCLPRAGRLKGLRFERGWPHHWQLLAPRLQHPGIQLIPGLSLLAVKRHVGDFGDSVAASRHRSGPASSEKAK